MKGQGKSPTTFIQPLLHGKTSANTPTHFVSLGCTLASPFTHTCTNAHTSTHTHSKAPTLPVSLPPRRTPHCQGCGPVPGRVRGRRRGGFWAWRPGPFRWGQGCGGRAWHTTPAWPATGAASRQWSWCDRRQPSRQSPARTHRAQRARGPWVPVKQAVRGSRVYFKQGCVGSVLLFHYQAPNSTHAMKVSSALFFFLLLLSFSEEDHSSVPATRGNTGSWGDKVHVVRSSP